MKILALQFKNLNSLYGEWLIDFTAPEYTFNGIFALTGPTGAGKSTILDALCLALYGATPRLGRITKSENEIMSRSTGECYAEVLFESQAGRFRCHWEQRRARKKASGRLQDQEHQIIDADTGKPIETKKSLVVKIVEEKTGMDFERFTRSILLAQGGFDTFLRADVELKSKILEQITGTQIYSEISRRVHDRRREEIETLNLLTAEICGILILDPEQEKQIALDLDEKLKQARVLSEKLTETGQAIAWLKGIDELKNEIVSLVQFQAELQSELEAFRPERDKLEQAVKAATLDGAYATLASLRKQQALDQASLKQQETVLPKLGKQAGLQAELLQSAEQLTLKAKENLKAATPLIQQVRSLDQKLAGQAKMILDEEQNYIQESAKIETDQKTRIKEQGRLARIRKSRDIVDQYLQAHAEDEWLISGLAGIEALLDTLLQAEQQIVEKKAELSDADHAVTRALKSLDVAAQQCIARKQELDKAAENLARDKGELDRLLEGKLLREYRTEKENLLRETAYIKKIEALEDQRNRLEDGKPCPLCGSIHHPFAGGNVPQPNDIEKRIALLTKRIISVEALDLSIQKWEKAQANARQKLDADRILENNAANDKKGAEKSVAQLKADMEKLKIGFQHLKQTISEKLQPLGISDIPEARIPALLDTLKSRLRAWQDQVKKQDGIQKQITDIDIRIKSLDAVIETRAKALAEQQEALGQCRQAHAAQIAERKKLYGDKIPDHEENLLGSAIADAEKKEKKARDLNSELLQKLAHAKAQVETLKNSIEQRDMQLSKAQTVFLSGLESAGFADELQFLDARLTHEDQAGLSFKAKALDDRQMDLTVRIKDRQTRLAQESEKRRTDKSQEELAPQFEQYEQALKQLRDAVAGLKYSLEQNEAGKQRVKAKQAAIEAQKKECARFEQLHGLIGSADGKKYRNFAQGLTFELMVGHANRQLEKMTDRYLLIRDAARPLDLNVVDNYQAGEIRSTKNLSGGESFIVSLSLALGLSRMASRKVRVDSLFLDEGFGTLDEDALDVALESLSGLHQDGKLIGIISHVSALKERISAQIKTIPAPGGRSSLSGPGCVRVSLGPNTGFRSDTN